MGAYLPLLVVARTGLSSLKQLFPWRESVFRWLLCNSPEFFRYPRGNANRVFLYLTFPKSKHTPPLSAESTAVLLVAFDIALELRCPVGLVRLRPYGLNASRMLMPEASMDKDNRLIFRKDDIGTARKPPVMEPKAKPHAMQHRTKYHLGFCVSRADAAHVPASSHWRQFVSHAILPLWSRGTPAESG